LRVVVPGVQESVEVRQRERGQFLLGGAKVPTAILCAFRYRGKQAVQQ